ncbi:MAG: asparagine synthase (glutamine-hydrolyzing) [Lentimicrobiaceae bacterium]|jgi:asparagine synthase (glutamine-hydrolysing)
MCGIAGFFNSRLNQGQALESIELMLQSIAHRGPDARDSWWNNGLVLGHNRLSIIDLSHQADQPMHYRGNVMVFNGEVYNYLELRKELIRVGYQFITQSDTEVVIAAYLEWGTDCVNHFVGMWAFALYDSKNNTLFASRDRFGIKPFYYIRKDNSFYFASELKGLKPTPVFSNRLNLNQVSRGLQMGWLCYNDETYFHDILALPAAHNLVIKFTSGEVKDFEISRYWDVSTGKYSNASFTDKTEQFRVMFAESIALHMRSDVPVATCLSGGLDSSAIVSEVQNQHPGTSYKSFSIYYDGDGEVDERPFINKVISKYPAIDPFYKKPTDEEVKAEFHNALFHADVPATGSSFVSQYFLMKLISENGIKVVLDGQGSDEYLGGYMHSYYRLVADMLKGGNFGKAFSTTDEVVKNLSLTGIKKYSHFAKSLLSSISSEQKLYTMEYRNYYPFLLNEKPDQTPFKLTNVPGTKLDSFLYNLMFSTSLPSLLQYEDRNSMAFSIESRVPFLDHRLVEFAFSLHNDDKIKGIETKRILRQSLKNVLPEAIVTRKDKKGFVTPGETKWLRGPLSHLTDINYSNLSFLRKDLVKSIMDKHRNGDNSTSILAWRIATLNYWIENFV